jgi:nitrile hydratase
MRKLPGIPELTVLERQAGAALPRDAGEPVFTEPWQAHAFAMVMALYQDGHYNWAEWDDYLGYHIQAPGHFGPAAESAGAVAPTPEGANRSAFLAACERDGGRFYHHWLAAAEQLLDERGLVPRAELEARVEALAGVEREGPRFQAGESVRVRDTKRQGHTHLPGYLRGIVGRVEAEHGIFVFPDAAFEHHHGAGSGAELQRVYGVSFAAGDIWGAAASGDHRLNFNLWDYQLEAEDGS